MGVNGHSSSGKGIQFIEYSFTHLLILEVAQSVVLVVQMRESALGTKATLRYSIWSSASIILHNGQKRTFASLRHSIQMAPYTPKMSTFLGELGHITSCSAEI